MLGKHIRAYKAEYFGIYHHVTNEGFFSWYINEVGNEKHFWVEDLYIQPEHRGIEVLLEYYDVAKQLVLETKCTHIMFAMDRRWDNFEKKKRVFTNHFGFRTWFVREDGLYEYFVRDVHGE